MESPARLYNPHLRASLVEGLEALLPINPEINKQSTPTLGSFHRQQLFISHPLKAIVRIFYLYFTLHFLHLTINLLQFVPNLLHIFVSIEMTGQGVQFEQKFNYRRPMYTVMNYLWLIPEHRNSFKLVQNH